MWCSVPSCPFVCLFAFAALRRGPPALRPLADSCEPHVRVSQRTADGSCLRDRMRHDDQVRAVELPLALEEPAAWYSQYSEYSRSRSTALQAEAKSPQHCLRRTAGIGRLCRPGQATAPLLVRSGQR